LLFLENTNIPSPCPPCLRGKKQLRIVRLKEPLFFDKMHRCSLHPAQLPVSIPCRSGYLVQ
ncbi:MAG: hypothetical protein V3S63_02720, partial [bacterium]